MRNRIARLATALTLTTTLFGCATDQDRQDAAFRTHEVFQIENFVERKNILGRQKLFDDSNTILFVYGLSDFGNVIFRDIAIGKVTSSEKRLEPITTDEDNSVGFTHGDINIRTNEVMQVDGTYGSSDKYVYWFTPEGIYRQWNGSYIATPVPITLREPVINFSDVDKEDYVRAQNAKAALDAGKRVNDKLEVIK